MFHHLIQFAGRGSCRNTIDGCAEEMQLTVFCKDTFPGEMWQAAMPGVVVTEGRSRHDSGVTRRSETSDAIRRAFAAVRESDSYVSSRILKGLAGLSSMRPNKFSEALARVREQGIQGWAYQKSRNGFTRCPFL